MGNHSLDAFARTFPSRVVAALLAVAVAFLAGLGCQREDDIVVYSAPKESATPITAAMGMGDGHDHSHAGEIGWTLPEGWVDAPKAQMSLATFAVSKDHPDVKVTITRVSAGQDLLANVNRWEGQLQLPATPAADLAKVVKAVDIAGHRVSTVDLIGPEPADASQPRMRMLAALLPTDGGDWAFKLMGPADVVGAQKANFDAFLKSVQFRDAHEAHDHAEHPAAAPAGDVMTDWPIKAEPTAAPQTLASWTAPKGWQKEEGERQMRVMTFQVTPEGGNGKAELVVSKFAGDRTGSLVDNVNRWRRQVNLAPVDQVTEDMVRTAPIGGGEWALFRFGGPVSGQADDAPAMIVGVTPRGNELWFFKLQGPANVVSGERENLLGFFESLRFEAPTK